MNDPKSRVTEIAELMDRFGLEEAHWSGDGVSVSFKRSRQATVVATAPVAEPSHGAQAEEPFEEAPATPAAPQGTPISSPMNGIFYRAASPNAKPFVEEGETVTAGQVVGLIEAMKVFNEITATVSGKVLSIPVESGAVVQPGEALIYVG